MTICLLFTFMFIPGLNYLYSIFQSFTFRVFSNIFPSLILYVSDAKKICKSSFIYLTTRCVWLTFYFTFTLVCIDFRRRFTFFFRYHGCFFWFKRTCWSYVDRNSGCLQFSCCFCTSAQVFFHSYFRLYIRLISCFVLV